jgi:hypothetical protein
MSRAAGLLTWKERAVNGKIWVVALMAFAAWGLASGCGSGGGEESTITGADFVSQGNEICLETTKAQHDALVQLGKEAKEGKIPSQGRTGELALVKAIASSVESMIDQFEELGAPHGKEQSVNAMLTEYEAVAEEAQAEPKKFFTSKGFVVADHSASQLGLVRCERM